MDNMGQYGQNGQNMPNGYCGGGANYSPNQYPPKKDRFGKGIGIGILMGALIGMMLCIVVVCGMMQIGMVHIAMNGEIYVQDTAVDDSDGIGSAVEHKLNAIDSLLESFYFDDVDDETAANNIYKAYLETYGDKYTVYYTPEEYQSIVESTSGKFYGIGAVCQKNEDGTILIVDAYEDAPAYKAGIRDGDCVVKVDGKDISELDLSAAVALIKGEKGTSVELEVRRSNQTFTVTIVRDEVKIQTVAYEMLENKIGYLNISQFDTVTTQQFKAALNDLQSQGMQSLIIDIRSNPGGLLDGVVDILDELLPDGLIVYTEDKEGNKKEYKGKNSNELNVPLAVLVNENSASASEIFAGAVQDYGKGRIIGTQTFGKGIVQTIRPLTDGSAVKYTIAKYFTPKGQDIHGKGVTPDQLVALPEDSETDTQLNAAIEYLNGQQ